MNLYLKTFLKNSSFMKLISYGKHSIDQSDINAVSKELKKKVLHSGDLVEKFE